MRIETGHKSRTLRSEATETPGMRDRVSTCSLEFQDILLMELLCVYVREPDGFAEDLARCVSVE